METKIKNSLNAAFHSLPDHIQEWLASEAITLLIAEINTKLGFKNEKRSVVPRLILRLTVQDLDPRDFINELSHELDISFQAAQTLTKELEDKVLSPIEIELRNSVGVDIKLMYFGQATAKKSIPSIPMGGTPMPTFVEESVTIKPVELPKGPDTTSWLRPKPITESTSSPKSSVPESPLAQTAAQPKIDGGLKIDLKKFEIKDGEGNETPFILHQETSLKSIQPQFTKEKPALNLKIQNSPTPEKPAAPKPISVRLETPYPRPTPITPQPKPSISETLKTVHYSNFLTPLEKEKVASKPISPVISQSPAAPQIETKKVILNPSLTNFKADGNTIDLRKKL